MEETKEDAIQFGTKQGHGFVATYLGTSGVVDGSVLRIEYAYQDDGRLSTVTTYGAATGGNIVSQVKYTYDGWGDVKTEQSHAGAVITGTPAVTYGYEDGADANGNALYHRVKKVTYPGGRVVHYLYESAPSGRLASVGETADGTQNLIQYAYLGMSTIVTESHAQVAGGLTLSYGATGTYSGWDRFGRVISQAWKKTDGTLVDGFGYTYDRSSNRTSKVNLLKSTFSETYAYDGLNRLIDTNRGGTDLQAWSLDALGNWDGFTKGAVTQTRGQNAANETTSISGTWVDPVYDAARNMTTMPKPGAETVAMLATYDAWNRLVTLTPQDGSNHAIFYAYDGFGRRISKRDGVRQDVGPVLVVNDGNAQRSMIKSMTVVFDHPVTLSAGAITLVQRNLGSVSINVSNPSGDNKTFLITFAAQGLSGGSLPNGIYDLSLQGDLVQDIGGGYTTSDRTWTFHRLVADYDGNGTVGSARRQRGT